MTLPSHPHVRKKNDGFVFPPQGVAQPLAVLCCLEPLFPIVISHTTTDTGKLGIPFAHKWGLGPLLTLTLLLYVHVPQQINPSSQSPRNTCSVRHQQAKRALLLQSPCNTPVP